MIKEYKSTDRPEKALEMAVDHLYSEFGGRIKTPAEFLYECCRLAQSYVLYAASKQPQSDTDSRHMLKPPPDLMMSKDLTEKIRPAVEQLRHELFGSSVPPFPTYEDAVQWLEQTAAEQNASTQAYSQTRIALEQSIYEKLEEYQVLTGEDYQLPFPLTLLEYAKPGSKWVHRVNVWGRTSLATLAHTSRKLVDATGFSQASVVAYILAGIPPLLASVHIDMSDGLSKEFQIFRRSATVTLRTPYITDAQWRKIRKRIRSEWHTERKKPVTQGKTQLRDIVQRHGGVPKDKRHGEQKAFWEQVQQEYNLWADKHGHRKHGGWKSTCQAYERWLKKTQQGYP